MVVPLNVGSEMVELYKVGHQMGPFHHGEVFYLGLSFSDWVEQAKVGLQFYSE